MTFAELVDTLLPGDGHFPSASAVGVHGLLPARLTEIGGEQAVRQLEAAVGRLDAAGIEREMPELFAMLRLVTFVSYYEMPAVRQAVRALGHRYNDTPLPKGYPVGRFDAAADTPVHGRGRFVPTDAVRRVDLSGLDFLGDDHV